MRDFATIQRELNLKQFLESPLGTLYFVPMALEAPRLLVRHFDGILPPRLITPFVSLPPAAQQWIERSPDLERLVRIEQPIEVGRDFVAREHHTYGINLSAYTDWEEPPTPPAELALMQDAFRSLRGKSTSPKDNILKAVLARSLLEPTSKTYFNEDEGRFVVVELKPTREEVERWARLMGQAGS